jgi:hypothetical protein
VVDQGVVQFAEHDLELCILKQTERARPALVVSAGDRQVCNPEARAGMTRWLLMGPHVRALGDKPRNSVQSAEPPGCTN